MAETKKTTIWTKDFICILIANGLMVLSHNAVNPMVSTYTTYLGAGPRLMGLLTGLFFGIALAMRPVAGPVTTRVDNRKLMMIVYSIGCFVNLGYAAFHTIPVFFVFRVLNGLQYAFVGSLGVTLAANSLPQDRLTSGLGIYGVSSAIAMSKAETKRIVSPFIRMPKGIVLHKGETESSIKAPCVIKPSNGGSSVGVIIVQNDEEFEKELERDFEFDDTVLVEEFIEGRELTQAVLDGEALPPVEICPDENEGYDYTNKYNGLTKEVCPAEIPSEVLAEMSVKSIRFGELVGLSVYYRIDYLLDKDGVLYALEANSLPGMTDTSLVPQEAAAVGISYPDLCEKIIEISLRKYE